MTDRLTIIGASVAGMAAALTAAQAGRRVDLRVETTRIGGSFGGVTAGGRRFDLGLRLFELDYEPSPEGSLPIGSFDPDRHTHRPFIASIAGLIRSVLGDTLVRASEPEMWISGQRTRCPLMTVDVSGLPAALSATDRRVILEQLHGLPAPQEHATLEAASLAQHGARLHALLTEAVCAKQFPAWRGVLASERRALWAALFHARTLQESFSGAPMGFRPHRPFCTTTSGVAHPFVDGLHAAVLAHPLIDVIPSAPLSRIARGNGGALTLQFGTADAAQVPAETAAFALPPASLFAAAGIVYAPQRLNAGILWVDVPERDLLHAPSTILIADPALSAFRISAAGSHAANATFAIEFGAAAPSLAAAHDALLHTGVIRDGARVTEVHRWVGAAQTAPVPASRDAFAAALARFQNLNLGAAILGGARRFGWDSLNDQIADALYFGATRC